MNHKFLHSTAGHRLLVIFVVPFCARHLNHHIHTAIAVHSSDSMLKTLSLKLLA